MQARDQIVSQPHHVSDLDRAAQYAAAHARWEAHKAQVSKAMEEDTETSEAAPAGATSYSSSAPAEASGTLASDEALAALREKLTGN